MAAPALWPAPAALAQAEAEVRSSIEQLDRLVKDRIIATAVIQEILGRALGPEGRSLIPEPPASS